MLSTGNQVELLLITISVTFLSVVVLILIIECISLVYKAKKVILKAEHLINNVESAAEAIGHMSRAADSRFPLLNLINGLFNFSKDKKK